MKRCINVIVFKDSHQYISLTRQSIVCRNIPFLKQKHNKRHTFCLFLFLPLFFKPFKTTQTQNPIFPFSSLLCQTPKPHPTNPPLHRKRRLRRSQTPPQLFPSPYGPSPGAPAMPSLTASSRPSPPPPYSPNATALSHSTKPPPPLARSRGKPFPPRMPPPRPPPMALRPSSFTPRRSASACSTLSRPELRRVPPP